MSKIGFIGAGNMAGAIIGGILKQGTISPSDLYACDLAVEKLQPLAQKGVHTTCESREVAAACDFIFLCVKPQNMADVLETLRETLEADKVIVSIAAGISAQFITQQLGHPCKIILAMPNTPLLIGYGATALSRGEGVSDEDFAFVKEIFASAGEVVEIAPTLMREVIPIHSSSPAFIYLFAKVIVEKAVEYGFDAKGANELFCSMLIGAAKMMTTTGMDHQQLIDMVSSPGGTTLKALETLHQNGFEDAIREAFDDCIKRAYELGK